MIRLIEAKMCFHADLIYHLLAHMNLNDNPSNLFSDKYIQEITQKKAALGLESSLEQELSPFINVYLQGFERLCLVNFVPFYTNNLEQTRNELLAQPFFTKEDKNDFLTPFLKIAEKEKETFYMNFWTNEINKYLELINQFNIYLGDKISKFKSIFDFYNVSPNIYLLLSITQNGRGIYIKDYFTAIVRLPRNSAEFSKSFILIFHEMTHQFTDALIEGQISISDDSHNLSESLVILTDFYLFQKYNCSMLEYYCNEFGISECSETAVNEKYSVPLEIREKMENMLLQF